MAITTIKTQPNQECTIGVRDVQVTVKSTWLIHRIYVKDVVEMAITMIKTQLNQECTIGVRDVRGRGMQGKSSPFVLILQERGIELSLVSSQPNPALNPDVAIKLPRRFAPR